MRNQIDQRDIDTEIIEKDQEKTKCQELIIKMGTRINAILFTVQQEIMEELELKINENICKYGPIDRHQKHWQYGVLSETEEKYGSKNYGPDFGWKKALPTEEQAEAFIHQKKSQYCWIHADATEFDKAEIERLLQFLIFDFQGPLVSRFRKEDVK